MRCRLFKILAAVSFLLCLMSLAGSLAENGHRFSGGIIEISMPIPSDAEDILVINWSGLEWWEYTPWDQQWYQRSRGSPALALVFAIVPFCWWFSRRRNRERRSSLHALCASCGYNLTGNVSGICPECGTPIASPSV
jgi:hypothetical protein